MIQPPITDSPPEPFDRYLTENQYAKESGISRKSLKIARTLLQEGVDWEHPKGKPIYWSKVGVDHLMKGMALSSGGISARAFAEACRPPLPVGDPQTPPPSKPEAKERPWSNFPEAAGGVILGGSFTSKSENREPVFGGLLSPKFKAVDAVYGAVQGPTEAPAPIVPRETLPVEFAVVHAKVPNPGLMLVVREGQRGFTKVRIRPGAPWAIGDRIQIRDIGQEVWEYVGRGPRYAGEFGGTGKVK